MHADMIEKWDIVSQEKTHPFHQLKDGEWVRIIARIRNNKTGEIRDYLTDGIKDNVAEIPHTWIWEQGNYSCDCNRELFFLRAKEEPEPEGDGEPPCGGEKYAVNLINPVTGTVFYREFEDV